MKRIVTLVLIIGILAGALFAVTVTANTRSSVNVTASCDTDRLELGETVTVTITNQAMTVSSFTCGIAFDDALVKVIAVTGLDMTSSGGDVWESVAVSTPDQANQAGTVGFAYASFEDRTYISGIVAQITFEAIREGNAVFTLYEDSDGANGVVSSEAHSFTCRIGDEPTDPQITLPPVNITKAIGHVTGNILYWDAVENAVFYQVYRLSADKTAWELITNTASTGYKDTTALEGVKSYYKIVARNGSVIGSMADATSVGIVRPQSITKLEDVTGLKATAHKSGNILSWNAVEGAKLYQIYRLSADKTTWELLKNTGSLAYKDETAQVNVRHYYKVIARNGDIKSSMNIASVSAVRPAAISKLDDVKMVSALGHKTGIIVSWDAVENAALYQLYRRAADETTWTLIKNTGSLAYKDTTAEPGIRYYYKVVARNGDIRSSLNIAAVSAIRPA